MIPAMTSPMTSALSLAALTAATLAALAGN